MRARDMLKYEQQTVTEIRRKYESVQKKGKVGQIFDLKMIHKGNFLDRKELSDEKRGDAIKDPKLCGFFKAAECIIN